MKIERKEKYLLITGEGEKKDLVELIEGSKVIMAAVEESDCRFVLADYRDARFRMNQTQAFNIVRHYESKMPSFGNIVAAVVVGADSLSIGNVWSDVAQSRGFNFKIFTSMIEAERWLLSQ